MIFYFLFFNIGVSEKVGPQAFFRCVSAKACAENHQVPTDVKGKSFNLILVCLYIKVMTSQLSFTVLKIKLIH